MRKRIFNAIALNLLFASSIWAQEFTTKMETIFTAENESTRLQHIKSAIDNKSNLHVVFTGYENQLWYGTNKNGTWQLNKLSYFDKDYDEMVNTAYYPNIAIDNSNNIHITMFDRYKEKLYYAHMPLAGNEFNFVSIKPSPEPIRFGVYGEYTDMAIDKNGGLHLICNADYTDKGEFTYNQCAIYFNKPGNSENWYIQVLVHDTKWDDRNWRYGQNSSIICYKNKIYVALGGDNELHFGTRDISAGQWDIDKLIHTSDEYINSQKYMLSLAVSPAGNIKFAFHDRSDKGGSPYEGLTIFSQNSCENNKWIAYNDLENPNTKNCPALAIDNNGKTYLALGKNGYALWHQTCDCNSEYKEIYDDGNNATNFVDMVIDKQNTVYAFYTSDYDNHLRLLTTKPNGTTIECNYPPIITNYTGKTNLKPGEKWTATITASDPECDKISFGSIIHNEIFTIDDHGNGTATVSATMPAGEGKGTPGLSIWVSDNKHPDINDKISVISFNLVITTGGDKKGSIKMENKCTGGQIGKPISNSNN